MAAAIVQPLTHARGLGCSSRAPIRNFAAVASKSRWLRQTEPRSGRGAHALAKLSECDCDRVILDRRLPDLDASEVAGFIRQRYPRTAIEMVDSRMAAAATLESESLADHCCEPYSLRAKSRSLCQDQKGPLFCPTFAFVAARRFCLLRGRAIRDCKRCIAVCERRKPGGHAKSAGGKTGSTCFAAEYSSNPARPSWVLRAL